MRPPRYYDQDFMANGGRINGVPLYWGPAPFYGDGRGKKRLGRGGGWGEGEGRRRILGYV